MNCIQSLTFSNITYLSRFPCDVTIPVTLNNKIHYILSVKMFDNSIKNQEQRTNKFHVHLGGIVPNIIITTNEHFTSSVAYFHLTNHCKCISIPSHCKHCKSRQKEKKCRSKFEIVK